MTKCHNIHTLLALRASDRSEDEQAQVLAHLATCPACAALAADYAQQQRLVADAPVVRLTPRQRSQLHAQMRPQTQHHTRQWPQRALGFMAAAAALMALGFLAGILLPLNGPVSLDRPPTPTLFQTVDQGARSGYDADPDEPTLLVIEGQDAWEAFWARHTQGEPAGPAPTIDFQQQVVLALLDAGHPSAGFGIEVVGLEAAGEAVAVSAVQVSPAPGCPSTPAATRPYHVVTTSRSDRPFALSLTKVQVACPDASGGGGGAHRTHSIDRVHRPHGGQGKQASVCAGTAPTPRAKPILRLRGLPPSTCELGLRRGL